MNDRLPALKQEFEWLSEPYIQVLPSVSLHLSPASLNFCQGSQHQNQSIQYPQNVKIADRGLKFPKLGIVKAKIHRLFEGKVKTVTVSLTPSDKYFASLLFEGPQPDLARYSQGKAVGIDLSLTHLAITSDGSKFDNPLILKKSAKNLKPKQQKQSFKVKGSNIPKGAKGIVVRVQEKIANTCKDFSDNRGKVSAKDRRRKSSVLSAIRREVGSCILLDGGVVR